MKISFNSLGFGSYGVWIPAYSLNETIKRIAEIGYDGIEIGAWRPHAWPYDLDGAQIENIRAQLKRYNMEASAICGVNHNLNLASISKEERNSAVEYYTQCINLASELETDIVVCVPGWRVYGTSYSEGYQLSFDSLSILAKEAEKKGTMIAIEPVNRNLVNLINTSQQAHNLMKELNSPSVKLMIDTYHVMYERESPVDVVELFGNDLIHVHCQDGIIDPPLRKVPGAGVFGFHSFLKKLQQIQYKRYLSVELWGDNPDQIAMESHTEIEKILKDLEV
jgi:protein FrlC